MGVIRYSLVVISVFFGIFIGLQIRNFGNHKVEPLKVYQESSRIVPITQQEIPVRRVSIPLALHRKYLAEYTTAIDGSFQYEVLYAIWTISQYQYKELQIFGSIGEIGIHHGRLTCYLYLMRRYEEQTLFGVDIISKQELSSNRSEAVKNGIFFKNLEIYANVDRDEVELYTGSSIDLNSAFSRNSEAISWWKENVVRQMGLQLISIAESETALSVYSDLCLASNSLMDGGVAIVDGVTDPSRIGVRDGVGRFLTETSTPIMDADLDKDMGLLGSTTTFSLSERIVQATNPKVPGNPECSRLIPFLLFYNKLFLTTPAFYPHYMQLLMTEKNFAAEARSNGTLYLEYNVYRLTLGHVPVWAQNHQLLQTQLSEIFVGLIEKAWSSDIDASDHHQK